MPIIEPLPLETQLLCTRYVPSVSRYSGTAGNSLATQNGRQFTTKDEDNDVDGRQNCAQTYKGGWWYDACHSSNLNPLEGVSLLPQVY